MPRKKPSEEMSIVPESVRDWWGGRNKKTAEAPPEDTAISDNLQQGEVEGEMPSGMRSESTQMARARRELRDADMGARPSMNPMRNALDLVSGKAMEQASRLSRANQDFSRTQSETGGYDDSEMASYSKMAKGGLVRKGRGGMVMARGHGKARTKPCKMC